MGRRVNSRRSINVIRRFFPGVLCLVSALSGALLLHPPAEAQGATIGPGTPCTFTVTPPTTNADGSPLTVPILSYRFYLDPPATGPVPGVTVPASAMIMTVTPPTAAASICKNVPTPIPTGNHTASVTATDAGGESAGSMPPSPFVFVGLPPAAIPGTSVLFK